MLAFALCMAGCASVRQSDVDAWRGAPVAALDHHAVFASLPMNRTVSPNGVEVRNYINVAATGRCNPFPMAGFPAAGCATAQAGCNNLFYIKDGRVLQYVPVGECATDEGSRPGAAR